MFGIGPFFQGSERGADAIVFRAQPDGGLKAPDCPVQLAPLLTEETEIDVRVGQRGLEADGQLILLNGVVFVSQMVLH